MREAHRRRDDAPAVASPTADPCPEHRCAMPSTAVAYGRAGALLPRLLWIWGVLPLLVAPVV